MSNASTIRRQVSGTQQLTLAPITTITTTGVTNFVLNNNGLTLSGGGVIPLAAGVTGLYAGTGQVLHIRAAGTYSGVTATTTTLQTSLYEVPAAIIAAGGLTQTSQTGFNLVAAPTAITLAHASGSFQFDAFIQLDAAGNLSGSFQASADHGTVQGPTVISDVTGLVGEADLNFVLAVTLGGAEPAGSIFTLNEFAIDLE